MCYSAMLEAEFRKMSRELGFRMSFEEFVRMYQDRLKDRKLIKVPKMMDLTFANPETPEEQQIKALIDQYRIDQAAEWESELFGQSRRLADAERSLVVKETKRARNDQRVATKKIDWYKDKLADLKSPVLQPADCRIFPMWYAPVVTVEDGEYLVRPMRYHCRPNGKPAFYDKKYDGLYNARRDSLEKFWKGIFGRRHAVMLATSFYENVALHTYEQRELRPGEEPSNVVLHFNPQQSEPMLVACLWDRWQAPGQPDLLSFTAITDEPPPEVAVTGHDRCVIPLKREHLAAWLNPAGRDKAELYAILDDRERPYYEHRMAA
jgi:putative SOS response-associated peptidase YedK